MIETLLYLMKGAPEGALKIRLLYADGTSHSLNGWYKVSSGKWGYILAHVPECNPTIIFCGSAQDMIEKYLSDREDFVITKF